MIFKTKTVQLICFGYTIKRKEFINMDTQNITNKETTTHHDERQFAEQQILHELEKINENLKSISDSLTLFCIYGIRTK